MTQHILGIDPGLASLGFGSIRITDDHPELLDYGIIKTAAKTDIGQRLQTIYDDLHELVTAQKPDLVAIEKLFFYRMGEYHLGRPGPRRGAAGISSTSTAYC